MGSLRKKCKTYGCRNLHHNASGYCDECIAKYREAHPRTESNEKPTSPARKEYSSWKWRKFSSDFLRLHPICAICGAPAEVCDHKDMTADMMVDAYGGFDYDPSHYQALCRSCNTRKGTREDRVMRAAYQRDLTAISQHPEGGIRKNATHATTAFGGDVPTHEEVSNV